jgi:hypothetical protein
MNRDPGAFGGVWDDYPEPMLEWFDKHVLIRQRPILDQNHSHLERAEATQAARRLLVR